MKPRRNRERKRGFVLAWCPDPGGRGLPKGRIYSPADVRALESAGGPQSKRSSSAGKDVHEDAGGQRLARAVAAKGGTGPGGEGGSYPLIARKRGLMRWDVSRLRRLNQ